MEHGVMEADATRQQQGEDRALQYCNYIFEVVLNLGTTFGFQAGHRSSLSTSTSFGTVSQHVPSSLYVVADHLSRALLDDVAARLCITDKLPLDLAFREAAWTVHAKLQAGYVQWTQQLHLPMRPVCQQIIDPSTRYTDDTVIRLLLSETALLLLLHTEASALQQLPSSCSLLYWLLRFSIQFKQALECAPLLSQAAAWAVPWNSRDMVLEVQTAAAELLSSVGQPALAEVEREWASRREAGYHPGRVLASVVSKAAVGQLPGNLTAQEALRVAYVFSTCDAAVMLEEVVQPLHLLLSFLEAHVSPGTWGAVCINLEARLQHPEVLHKALASLSVVDCHCVADTFRALRDLGQHADGRFDANLAAVWWEELLMESGRNAVAVESRYPFGSTSHILCAALLVVQGTIAMTISLGASKKVQVCRNPDRTSCVSITGLAWSSLLLSHAAMRLIEALGRYYHLRCMTRLPRLTPTLSNELCLAARNKISHLPIIVPMGLKGAKETAKETAADAPETWECAVLQKAQSTFTAYSGLLHSLWGVGIWFATMLACFGLLFVRGTVGAVFEMAWWIIAVTHLCLMGLSLLQDWFQWRQSAASRPLPPSLKNKARGFLRGLLWLVAVFGLPAALLWLVSVPATQALERILWFHINRKDLTNAARLTEHGHSLVLLAAGALSTNMLGGLVLLLLLSMAIRLALWAMGGGVKMPLRSQNNGKWEELCGCFDQLAETWCLKFLPQISHKENMEEQAASGSNAGCFPVVWNGLVDDLVQRDLLASSEGETLAYTRIINVTTPSLLSSLGLPDMMPPAYVVGPALHQWLQQKANPTATVTLPVVQVLRLLLLLMHHADVLNTGELIVMSLAVEEGMRVAKRQHVAIKHIVVEGMKIMSWAYKGGLQPNSDWLTMVKKHSKMTDAIFNFICAFQLGVAPSAATAGDVTPPQSPTRVAPKEASADHVAVAARGLPQIENMGDSVTSLHGGKPQRGTPVLPPAGPLLGVCGSPDVSATVIMSSNKEAQEEAAKVTALVSKQLPALKTKSASIKKGDDGVGDEASCSTPACSEMEFESGMYTPRSQSGDSESSVTSTPRRRKEQSSPQRKLRKKGHDAPPPPPLIARLLRRTMGKSHYFMALSLYMVKLRRTPNWSKSEPEVPAAAEELLSFMESVFHPSLGQEPPPPALAAPSLTSVLPLLPGQVVLPTHQSPEKAQAGKQAGNPDSFAEEDVEDPSLFLFTLEGLPSPQLSQMIKRHMPEWQNFQERIAAMTGLVPVDVRPSSFTKAGNLHHLQWEFLMWVGQRSSTLVHQVQVLASIHRATPTLLSAERPLSLAVGPKVYAMWLEAVADLKYQAVVLAPHLCSHMSSANPRHQWNARSVAALLSRFSFMRAVSLHQELCTFPPQLGMAAQGEPRSYSVLLKGCCTTTTATSTSPTSDDATETPSNRKRRCAPDNREVTNAEMTPVYLIKLPRNPYAPTNSSDSTPTSAWWDAPTICPGTGASSRSMAPLVRPFLFTEYVQTCSLPVANLGLASALLIRSILNELYWHDAFTNVFMGSITSVTVPMVEPTHSVALGEASSLRNWVVSQSLSSFMPDTTNCDVVSVSSASMQDFVTGPGPLSQRSQLPPAPLPASPSKLSVLRTSSIVSSSNFSLMMQVNASNNVSQAGSPLSTPKFAGASPWPQRKFGDGMAKRDPARESLQGRDADYLLQSRDLSTPRSQASMLDFQRNNRLSYELDSTAGPDCLTSPASPEHTIDDSSFGPCIATPRPFKLFERTLSAGSQSIDVPSFSLPPPGPSMDSTRSESGALFNRSDSAKLPKLPALKTSLKPPTPSLTSSSSFGRSKEPGSSMLLNPSSSASFRITGTASVSGMTEPETATASVITINSNVPQFESSVHFIPPDTSQPLLSSAASVVEQRFVMAASAANSWAGFVAGRFAGQGTTHTQRYLAALANLLCLPAQAVGWQPAALCFVDKTWEMSHIGTAAADGVTAYSSCGVICSYIMVDMLGPQTAEDLSVLLSHLLHGTGVAWLAREGTQTALWLQKVLEMHVRATLWCLRLLPLYIPLRALVQLVAVPVGWTHSLGATAPTFYALPNWDTQSSIRFWVDLSLSLAGLFLALPFFQVLLTRLLHGWRTAGHAAGDMLMSWLPTSITLLLAAKTCPHLSQHQAPTSAVPSTESHDSREAAAIEMVQVPAAVLQAHQVEEGKVAGRTAGNADMKCRDGDSIPAGTPLCHHHALFVRLHSQWGRQVWVYAMWLMLLGALVLGSYNSSTRPLPVYTAATAGVLPLLLGVLLMVAPHCLAQGCSWECSSVVVSLQGWLQWMGESLGVGPRKGWKAVHAAHMVALQSTPQVAWLGQLLGMGCGAVVVLWFAVVVLQSMEDSGVPGPGSSKTSTDLFGRLLGASRSQGLFAFELAVRGAVAWAAQLVASLLCCAVARVRQSRQLHGLQWIMALMLALIPLALLTACFFGPVASAPSLGASFYALYIVVVCNCVVAGCLAVLLSRIDHPVVQAVVQHMYWLNDVLVGICLHVVWWCLATGAMLRHVLSYVAHKVEGVTNAFKSLTTRSTAPATD